MHPSATLYCRLLRPYSLVSENAPYRKFAPLACYKPSNCLYGCMKPLPSVMLPTTKGDSRVEAKNFVL